MWLIHPRLGFFSVVVPRDQQTGELELDRLMVRARRREHLELLRSQHAALADVPILRSPDHADYRWRVLITRSAFIEVMHEIVEQLAVVNVKADAHRHEGATGAPFVRAMHATHALFARLQNETGA